MQLRESLKSLGKSASMIHSWLSGMKSGKDHAKTHPNLPHAHRDSRTERCCAERIRRELGTGGGGGGGGDTGAADRRDHYHPSVDAPCGRFFPPTGITTRSRFSSPVSNPQAPDLGRWGVARTRVSESKKGKTILDKTTIVWARQPLIPPELLRLARREPGPYWRRRLQVVVTNAVERRKTPTSVGRIDARTIMINDPEFQWTRPSS
ncbi:hypothetical protein C8R47DRAFT_557436 [Mycena vitilis]|nr:hypothetical protein C8R47DRAFT_557436 [Mycena vitilis]